MSFYLDDRFPMQVPKTVELPSDLVVAPIQGNFGLSICHSDTTNKWYAIRKYSKTLIIDGTEVVSGLIDLGSWAELANHSFTPYFAYAPFMWGTIYKSKIVPDGVQYMPIWEQVETGEYNDEGLPIMKEVYKLVVIMPYHAPIEADNPIQYNFDSRFHVEDYGNDLVRLTCDLELFTGKKF